MFKKCAAVLFALMMILAFTLPVSAETTTFTDDFSSGTFENWSNPAIDNIAGVVDTDTNGVAKMENGVMEIDNAATNGSFFYIGVKDLKAFNFTLTMKVRIDQFNDGWLGISFRKDFNDRYNACNNNMVTLRAQTDNKLAFQGYRGYAGSAVLLNNSVSGGYVVEDASEWITWKLEVQDSKWRSYINDELFGEWYYTKNQNEGYISINACLFDGAVDDIEITGEFASVTPPTQPTEPSQPGDEPTEPGDEPTNPGDQPTDPVDQPTEPGNDPTQGEETDTSYIKSIYKDVTIDYLFGAITLEKPLSVADFNLSFKLSDGYRLALIDVSGAEVTEDTAMVTEDLKAVVFRGEEKIKEYTLVVNEAEATEPVQNTTGNQDNAETKGLPTGALVAIVVSAILVVGAIAVALILKKKPTK